MSLDGSNRQLDVLQIGTGISRRRFLVASASGVAAAALTSLLSACGSPAAPATAPTSSAAQPAGAAAKAGPGGFSGGGTLKLLMSQHFVPAYDKWLDDWAAEWGTKNKVEVQVDHILSAQLAEKIAAEVAANGGHDLYRLSRNGEPALYNKQLVDVGDVVKQAGEAYGGWIPYGEALGLFEGTWRAVPEYFIDRPGLYRKDIFDENGLTVVDTWDDLLKVGPVIKAKGHPVGIAINQKSNDANNSWTACLWCHGASTVAADGKTVTLNSPETRQTLTYAIELFNKCETPEVLSWDDSADNLSLASGVAGWIHDPISAYRTIEKDTPDLANKIYISNTPAGPKGRMVPTGSNSWGLMNWSTSVPAAKAFLTDYYAVLREATKSAKGYNQPLLKDLRKKPMPFLGEEPKLNILQDYDQNARSVGWPGPPTAAAGEVESNWIIPLMVARAVTDNNVNSAVEWATQKIEAIYAKH
jgi:multiple sugar transport system substrate-binding protein